MPNNSDPNHCTSHAADALPGAGDASAATDRGCPPVPPEASPTQAADKPLVYDTPEWYRASVADRLRCHAHYLWTKPESGQINGASTDCEVAAERIERQAAEIARLEGEKRELMDYAAEYASAEVDFDGDTVRMALSHEAWQRLTENTPKPLLDRFYAEQSAEDSDGLSLAPE